MPSELFTFPDIETFVSDCFDLRLELCQKEFLAACEQEKAVLANMPRQVGVSLTFALRALYKAYQTPHTRVYLIGPSISLAQHILHKSRILHERTCMRPEMAARLPQITNLVNRSFLKFSNHSAIEAISMQDLRRMSFGRQESPVHLQFEAFSKMPNDQEFLEFLTTVLPNWIRSCATPYGSVVIASSPRRGSYFNQLWKRTLKLSTMFRPFQIFLDELSEEFQQRLPRLREFISPKAWETEFECKVE